jgi:hypothetical protein
MYLEGYSEEKNFIHFNFSILIHAWIWANFLHLFFYFLYSFWKWALMRSFHNFRAFFDRSCESKLSYLVWPAFPTLLGNPSLSEFMKFRPFLEKSFFLDVWFYFVGKMNSLCVLSVDHFLHHSLTIRAD